MNAAQLDIMKAGFAREILNEQNENLLKKSIAFFFKEREATMTPPCGYTVDELNERIDRSMEDYRTGRMITTEELGKKMAGW